MIGIALSLLAAVAVQDQPVPYTAVHPSTLETYAPPPVRPFEPPASFGVELAQGDAAFPVTRRALSAPVTIEAYGGHYEPMPSDLEVAYQQGVTNAALRGDDRMGPLDGRWRVVGADGSPVLDLLLTDPGAGREVEGAWKAPAGDDLGVLSGVSRSDAALTVSVPDPESPAELRLQADGSAWRGVMVRDGRSTPVEMRPVG